MKQVSFSQVELEGKQGVQILGIATLGVVIPYANLSPLPQNNVVNHPHAGTTWADTERQTVSIPKEDITLGQWFGVRAGVVGQLCHDDIVLQPGVNLRWILADHGGQGKTAKGVLCIQNNTLLYLPGRRKI